VNDTITVFIEDDGSITFLDAPCTRGLSLGSDVVRRYSHVEPESIPARVMFHAVRLLFGDTGSMSDWTRRWDVLWRARILATGVVLPIRSTNRQQVIDAEIAYFNLEGIQ
jgi:hypothetical protein